MDTDSKHLVFEDLQPFLLLKNGNFLYKVPFRGGWAVIKVYYGSRTPWQNIAKSLENFSAGQTSYLPKTRRRVERECIDLWRRHGFRVFEVFDDVSVSAPGCPPDGYAVLEYVQAPKLDVCLSDAARPLEERLQLYRRFLTEWGRRHALAISANDPRLVHENGDANHVLILDDGAFLWFDFEMIYRNRRHVDLHVSHEIIQYLWYLNRNTSDDFRERLLFETVAHYPDCDRLRAAYDFFFAHPNPLHRWGRALERRFKRKAQASDSKYSVARRLRETLNEA